MLRLLAKFRLLPKAELIGAPDCPLLFRWTLYDDTKWYFIPLAKTLPWLFDWKLMVHFFVPYAEDTDPHDHPRSFATLVIKGGYLDIVDGKVERMERGRFRFRRSTHAHITAASSAGAWTIVVMGPLERPWGFIKNGRWWPWKKYEKEFGLSFRCDTGPDSPLAQR